MDLENHEQWLNPPLSTPPEDVLDAAKLVVYRSVIANGLNMSPDEADILVETIIFAALPFIMKWFINSLPAPSTADTQRVARKPVVDELTQRTLGYIKGDS